MNKVFYKYIKCSLLIFSIFVSSGNVLAESNYGVDTDNDGVADADEMRQLTDPLKADTDEDGVNDWLDMYPLDSSRSTTTITNPKLLECIRNELRLSLTDTPTANQLASIEHFSCYIWNEDFSDESIVELATLKNIRDVRLQVAVGVVPDLSPLFLLPYLDGLSLPYSHIAVL